jgi:hypothetical protein
LPKRVGELLNDIEKIRMKKLIFIVVALYFGLTLTAFGIPSRPNPPTLVTDLADVFSANEKNIWNGSLSIFLPVLLTKLRW